MGNMAQMASMFVGSQDDDMSNHEKIKWKKAAPKELADALATFYVPRNFKKGDFVTQIEGQIRYRFPEPGMPAVVVDVYERRSEDRQVGDGNAFDFEDMTIATMPARGQIRLWPVDSRCFEAMDIPSIDIP